MQKIENDIRTEINEKRIPWRCEDQNIILSTRNEQILEATHFKQLQGSTFICNT